MSRIRAGDTEPIESLVRGFSADPLPGKSDIVAQVRRNSDGATFDWSDSTFKAFASCISPTRLMPEIDPTGYPGQYGLNFDTSAIVNAIQDDTYQVTVDQDPRSDAANMPQVGEIKTGLEDISQTEAQLACAAALTAIGLSASSGSDLRWLYERFYNRMELGADGAWRLWNDADDAVQTTWAPIADVDGQTIAPAAGTPARRPKGS